MDNFVQKEAQLAWLWSFLKSKRRKGDDLNSFVNIRPKTLDGKKISIEANVDNEDEFKESMKKGINGIGLYRSEYLFYFLGSLCLTFLNVETVPKRCILCVLKTSC